MTAPAVTNTFSSNTLGQSGQVNTNFSDLVTYLSNRNDGTASWDRCLVTSSTAVPLIVNNSTGTSNIANFQDNGSTVFQIVHGGDIYMNTTKKFYLDGGSNTYLTESASDQFDITTGGTLALRATSGQDIYTTTWTDYSATSTVAGWSAFTNKLIFYKKIGKIVYVQFDILGTSNATSSSFTLPVAMANSVDLYSSGFSVDNGTAGKVLDVELTKNTNTVNLFPTPGTTLWTASGTKATRGQFWYQTT